MASPENIATGKRLGAARREAGYDVSAASEALGIPVSTIKAHEKGARTVRLELATKYARLYSVDPMWIMGLTKIPTVMRVETPVGMPVVGTLAAGFYQHRDALSIPAYEATEYIPVQFDQSYNEAVQVGLKITGPGMNREYPDGSYVVCIGTESSDIRLGDHVVCRRYHGADVAEFSVRELERDQRTGLLRLASLSNDPRYQSSIVLKDGEAEIIAIVISSYRPRARRGQMAIPPNMPQSPTE